MTSEQKLRDALAAYRDAIVAASAAAAAVRDELQDDILVSTLAPFQALQQAATGADMISSFATQAIKALDDRAAALAANG